MKNRSLIKWLQLFSLGLVLSITSNLFAGDIKITSVVEEGLLSGNDPQIWVGINCENNHTNTTVIHMPMNSSKTVTGFDDGAVCNITGMPVAVLETDKAWVRLTDPEDGIVTVSDDTTAEITITNSVGLSQGQQGPGRLVLKHRVTGVSDAPSDYFTVDLSCSDGTNKFFGLNSNQSVIEILPVGTICMINQRTNTAPNGYYYNASGGTNYSPSQLVEIAPYNEPRDATVVTITDDIISLSQTTSDLVVSKTVSGGDTAQTFTIRVDCTYPYSGATPDATFNLAHGESGTASLRVGSRCTITEDTPTTAPDGFEFTTNSASITPSTVTIPANGQVNVTVTNRLTAISDVCTAEPDGHECFCEHHAGDELPECGFIPGGDPGGPGNPPRPGKLEITKVVTGGADFQDFTVNVDCTKDEYDQTVHIAAGETVTINNIAPFTRCTVTEDAATSPTGFTYNPVVIENGSPARISDGNTVAVTVTNELVRGANKGELIIQKVVEGGTDDTSFTMEVTCDHNNTQFEVVVGDNESATVSDLPEGAICFVREQTPVAPDGFSYSTIITNGTVTIDSNNPVTVVVTNTLVEDEQPDEPGINVVKPAPVNADNDGSGDITKDDVLTYTITATNTGNVALNNVVVNDALIVPSTKTCVVLAVGETCILTGTHTVTLAEATSGTLSNSASVNSDEIPTASTATVSSNITPPPTGPNPPSNDPVKVPTLSEWALFVLIMMLGFIGYRQFGIRKRH